MTSTRYRAYCHVRDHLDGPGCYRLGDEERGLLMEVAEEMLLSRELSADDLEDSMESAAIALSTLTAVGRLDRALGVELWQHICAAGPPPGERTALSIA
jgi:hypothetical protein